jgi:hypothetical protein
MFGLWVVLASVFLGWGVLWRGGQFIGCRGVDCSRVVRFCFGGRWFGVFAVDCSIGAIQFACSLAGPDRSSAKTPELVCGRCTLGESRLGRWPVKSPLGQAVQSPAPMDYGAPGGCRRATTKSCFATAGERNRVSHKSCIRRSAIGVV